jgi:hypothetical protein
MPQTSRSLGPKHGIAAYVNKGGVGLSFPDAPNDGKMYGRQSGAWVEIVSASPPSSVWSAADATTNSMTLSNGGLTVTPPVTVPASIRGSVSKSSGKFYVEFAVNSPLIALYQAFGVASASFGSSGAIGDSNYSGGVLPATGGSLTSSGFTYNGTRVEFTIVANDVIGMAVDFNIGNMWFSQNGLWSNSGDPAANLLPIISFQPATVGALFPTMSFYDVGSGDWTLQAAAASQKYATPVGFSSWG